MTEWESEVFPRLEAVMVGGCDGKMWIRSPDFFAQKRGESKSPAAFLYTLLGGCAGAHVNITCESPCLSACFLLHKLS
jgi:hypothetical protein